MSKYEHLLSPIKIGETTVKNRIFMPPLSTNLADKGYVTDELVEHLEADFAFSFWKKVDQDHTAVRLCTSWATEPAAIQALIQAVDRWEEG